MEDTQAINWDVEEEEETEQSRESLGCSLEPVGRLRIFSGAHGPEKDFPLYVGKNVIGRMPDCSVALPFPSISKQHAVIEVLAWDKAPILRDCGSLNGTQILRPPKVLSPEVSHRLRDKELILFADLPCQYHRLDVPLPFVSRGPLTVEETPRVQGGTQPQRLLLAEDSEEEVDSLSERCVMKESRTTSSPLSTVVPESDEEGPSPAPSGPGPHCAFNMDSDTDEEEGQQPATGKASSAARRGATAEAEHPAADGVATKIQCEKDQPSVKERDNDTKVKRDAGNGVVPVRVILERSQPPGEDRDTEADDESRPPGRPAVVHLERAQPCGIIDSDTDVEEEGIPATPAVVPMKKRQIFRGVGTRAPGAPGWAHLRKSQAGSDTEVEESEAPRAIPLQKSRASMVIDSDTDDEEEVSAALTLARLKESQAVVWNRDMAVEEDRAQPMVLPEQSQTASGRDSDTDVEEEGLPVEKRETVPEGHTDKDGAIVIAHSEENQPPPGDGDVGVEADDSSPGIHLERSQASGTVDVNTEGEEDVPPGPAVVHLEKHQVSVEGTYQTDVEAERGPPKLPVVPLEESQPPLDEDGETDVEGGTCLAASAATGVRKSQLPAEGDAGTEQAAAVLERERALEVGAQGGSPAAQVERDLLPVSRENLTDVVVDTGTPEEPTQPQREGAQTSTGRQREPHVGMTKDSEDNEDYSEDLALQATQCFVERENESLEAVQSMEDEPPQVLTTVPPEPGPSHCSFQAPGALDEPWEVLATQPFCLRESEASETQPIATYLEAHGSCLSPPRATPQDQHPESPVHTILGIQGKGMQTVDKGQLNCKTPPAEKASREDQESPDACLPPTVPEASTPPQGPLLSQSQRHLAPQSLLSPFLPSLEPPIPKTRQNGSQKASETPLPSELECFHPKPKVRPQGSSRMTLSPVSSTAPEPHPTTPTAQPVTPEPTSRATRGRTNRSSLKTPDPIVSIAPELQPSTSTDQPVTPEPTSRATRGRRNRSSVKTPEPIVPTTPELQPSTSTDQPVTPKPTSRATRGRRNRSSVKTPDPIVPTTPELQPSTSTDQPVTPEPTSRATRGRRNRSSVKTPEPIVPTTPELQPSTSTAQPVTPKPTSRATRGRRNRSSVKTPEPIVPTTPELQPSTSTAQPVIPKPTSRATRGRTNTSSVKGPEPIVPTAPELQPSTSTAQPVTPKPTSRATRGKTHGSSVKTSKPVEPTTSDLEPPTPTDQPVTPKAIAQGGQSRTLRSSTLSAVPDQPVSPEPIPQASCSRSQRAAGKHSSLTAPIVHKTCSVSPEPKPRSSRSQRRGAVRAAESLTAIPEPAFLQLLEASQMEKVEAPDRSGFTPEPQPKASQSRKRPLATMASPPLPKRPQRGEVSQKTAFLKEEEEDTAERPGKEEVRRGLGPQSWEKGLRNSHQDLSQFQDVEIPAPGKRKRDQAEEEPKGIPSRSLRRTKPNQESPVPKVLFTGVVDARGERAVLALGGSLASSVAEASHLVTDRIRRTVKFLCALGRGIPILSLDWLHQSRKAGCFLPPDEYVVIDPEQEKNFGFSLRDALSRARERRLLEGYEIHVTPGVQPPPPQMGEIISCCGGTALPNMPRSYKPQRVVITCPQDFPRCSIPLRVGLPLLSPEFLLTGVLKQEAKPEAFVLSTLEMSST
ncbi:mediator of DNA damage checkpoint protein 1 isoform X6 [Eulemur rufifrons]|uniref:mediator of DNA damage checkpoint protein 1 isoform X6 n=1 Tax=Eulemur rufifrons TaxID=859984 RepID=UPI003742AA03